MTNKYKTFTVNTVNKLNDAGLTVKLLLRVGCILTLAYFQQPARLADRLTSLVRCEKPRG